MANVKIGSIPGIEFKKTVRNPTLTSENSYYDLEFGKGPEYFALLENLNKFVKHVEALCRKSKFYSRYVKFIKEDIGLKTCQVFSNIDIREDSDVTIEMHHGPILTLYDYVVIVIDHLLVNGETKMTTFDIADIIMQEHFKHNIQVVMLSKTAHEAVDEGLFINYKQGFGNLHNFLERYKDGISPDQAQKINRYFEMSEMYGTYDNNLFDLQNTIKCWARENLF